MIQKHPIVLNRIRNYPNLFSWVDRRLVRDDYLQSLTHPAAALYLFLIAEADSQGLSCPSNHTLDQHLAMSETTLIEARSCLIRARLIAYQDSLYQVLDLTPYTPPRETSSQDEDATFSIQEILKKCMGGKS